MFAGKITLYLYHVILGKGEPVAEQLILTGSSTPGVCKTRTGYLRMADADGECGRKNADRKMRTVKGGWKKC